MQKLILPSVLVLGIFIIGLGSFQDAYAVPNCASAVLAPGVFYVSSQSGFLHKVQASDQSSCTVGKMTETNGDPTNVVCQDIAIDHTNFATPSGEAQLYCLAFGTHLHTVDRLPTAGEVDTDLVGVLTDPVGDPGDPPINEANAMDIDAEGRAYIAAGLGNEQGNFYSLNLNTAVATLRTAFGSQFVSAGDLAFDETTNLIYWTVLCQGLFMTADQCTVTSPAPPALPNTFPNDRLYRIALGSPDTLTPLAELPKGKVFAMEFVSPTLNLCYVNVDGFIWETDRDGLNPTTQLLLSPLVLGFGAAANIVGGSLVMLNTMALLIAAGQTNAAWLILLAISGVAVVSYQFKDKIKSKNKKINE